MLFNDTLSSGQVKIRSPSNKLTCPEDSHFPLLYLPCLGLKDHWVGRPREAVLGLPSRNCAPRRGVGSAFRARRLISLHPGLKHPTSQSLRRGRTFGITYHITRGAIA